MPAPEDNPGRRPAAPGEGPGRRPAWLIKHKAPAPGQYRATGVRMALLSNARGHGVEEIVAHFALDEYMAAAVSSLETGAV